ncbi:MAG TPA: hypothetical protein VJW75_07865, partial [Candidatus Eisenbacteria bacterium]|nr:hypothetical protein [Candidatus Eisenbacteria bacterium]
MRAFDWVPTPRWPASAFLWSLLVTGHAVVAWAPLPAVLLVPAFATACAAGAVSLALAVLALRRSPGIRRSGLAGVELVTGVLAAVAAGMALGAEADRDAWPLPVHPRPIPVR